MLHFVTITPYKEYLWNMQLQTKSPESKFPNEYSDVIFFQIDQHLKKWLQKYKGVLIFMNHGVQSFCNSSDSQTVKSYYSILLTLTKL